MVEIDVIGPPHAECLVVAHSAQDLLGPERLRFEDALALALELGSSGMGLNIDLKLPGYELAVLDALRARDAVARTLVSTMEAGSLALLRRVEPSLRLGWSVPKVRRDPMRSPLLAIGSRALLPIVRRALSERAERAIRAGHCDAIMSNHHLVSAGLVRAVHRAAGELYVWTVDDADEIASLETLGVDGVITNDPRLFGSA